MKKKKKVKMFDPHWGKPAVGEGETLDICVSACEYSLRGVQNG